MAKKGKKDYFGLPYVASVILAIFPFTAWIFGAITRILEGKIVAGILRLIGLGIVMWIIDIVFMIKKKQICRVLNV
jgi:hypothetical protein